MIFVTVGNHNQQFTRLIKHIDTLAPSIKEEIVIQRGYTTYVPRHCKSFAWATSLDPYYKKARVIIAHAGIGTLTELLRKHKKPVISVPRWHKYGEHINDHQVGMAQYFDKQFGVKTIYEIQELTLPLLKRYKTVIDMNESNLRRLQAYLKEAINAIIFKKKPA